MHQSSLNLDLKIQGCMISDLSVYGQCIDLVLFRRLKF